MSDKTYRDTLTPAATVLYDALLALMADSPSSVPGMPGVETSQAPMGVTVGACVVLMPAGIHARTAAAIFSMVEMAQAIAVVLAEREPQR